MSKTKSINVDDLFKARIKEGVCFMCGSSSREMEEVTHPKYGKAKACKIHNEETKK